MWLYFFALALCQCAYAQSGSGNPSEDVTTIRVPSDLLPLASLTTFPGSLTFHSGYDVNTTDLCTISNLEIIQGYLVIINSPGIQNLKCLRNLKSIEGHDLHHHGDSVFIEDNVNRSTGHGMCFVDTLNWTLIADDPVSVRDNGQNCPSCHPQCQTCWGAGPRLCQTCSNFRSGITCVSSCPSGTLQHNSNSTCTEYLEPTVDMALFTVNQQHWNNTVNVTFDWSLVGPTNGVPLGYRLFLNNQTVHEAFYEDYLPTNNGMVESPPLQTTFDTLLNHSRTYEVRLQILNSVGWSNVSVPYTVTTMDSPISKVRNLSVSFDRNDTSVSWLPPLDIGGQLVRYHLMLAIHNHNGTWELIHSHVNTPNQTNHSVTLTFDSEYRVCIVAYNLNWASAPNCLDFTVPEEHPPAVTNLTVEVINATHAFASWSSEGEDEHEDHDEHLHIVHLHHESVDVHEHHEHNETHRDDILLTTNESSVTFDNLRPNSTYTLEVHCLHDYGVGLSDTVNFSTPVTNPPTPDAPVILNNTLTDIWIQVSPVSDENGYVTNYSLLVEHIEHGVIEESEAISLGRFTENQTISLDSLVHLHDDHDYRLRLIAYVGNLSTESPYSATSQLVTTTTTTVTSSSTTSTVTSTTTTISSTSTTSSTTSTTSSSTSTTSSSTSTTSSSTSQTQTVALVNITNNDNDEWPLWLLIFLIIAGGLFVAIIIFFVYYLRKKYRKVPTNVPAVDAERPGGYTNPVYDAHELPVREVIRNETYDSVPQAASTSGYAVLNRPGKSQVIGLPDSVRARNEFDTTDEFGYSHLRDNVIKAGIIPVNTALPYDENQRRLRGSYIEVKDNDLRYSSMANPELKTNSWVDGPIKRTDDDDYTSDDDMV